MTRVMKPVMMMITLCLLLTWGIALVMTHLDPDTLFQQSQETLASQVASLRSSASTVMGYLRQAAASLR